MKLTDQAKAVELFSAAWCNLQCDYCYIPKHNQTVKDKHKEIIEEVKKVDPLINRLKYLYNDNLEIISHWGSEPSLTIKHFKDFYKKVVETFPKFYCISFSSNFMQNTEDVVDFIKTFPQNKKYEFDIQLSLDGPKWITDQNRKGGTTEKITENIIKFIELLNNENNVYHTVKTHFKPTVSRHQFKELLENDNLYNYYKFWDNFCSRMVKANKNRNVSMVFNCDPTIVCPDEYTQQDGINFNNLYERTIELKYNNDFKTISPSFGYYNAMQKVGRLTNEFFVKQKMFTCSAGDSQFGLSEYLHPCHDTFYHPYEGIKEAFFGDMDRLGSEFDVNNIRKGRYELAKNNLTRKFSNLDDKEIHKYLYRLRAYHDFSKHKITTAVALIKELADCGLISECYKHDEMATLLSIYVNTRHSCPTGNVENLGSQFLNFTSYYKLFGNGLLENFLKKYIEEQGV